MKKLLNVFLFSNIGWFPDFF